MSGASTRRKAAGFTIIELLIAIVILSVGFIAVYTMQVLVVEGNINSAQMAEATALGERWVEILRREALRWNAATGFNNCCQLSELMSPANLNSWQRPVNNPPCVYPGNAGMVNGENVDVTLANPQHRLDQRYCIWLRGDYVVSTGQRVARVEVRVLWPKTTGNFAQFINCPANMLNVGGIQNLYQITIPSVVYQH